MGFVECVGGTTGVLLELIERNCPDIGLDMSLCRGQGYDGVGNMAGLCSGAAKIIQQKYPKSHLFSLCIS